MIEYNRVVLTDFNIRSWVSIGTTGGFVLLIVGVACGAVWAIDRRWAIHLPALRAAPLVGSWAVLFGALAFSLMAEPAPVVERVHAPPPHAPNVIVFVSDCLRADHVSIAGYERPTTPTFDRLAREGVRFTDAQAAASWTLPSVVGLLTSVPPGIEMTPGGLSSTVNALTLPEVLAQHGYSTYGASNNPHLSGPFGLRSRFQRFDDGGSRFAEALDATVFGNLRQRVMLPSDEDIVARVAARLADLEEPYFVYVHLMGGHSPYELPAGYAPPFSIPPADREISSPHRGMEISAAERANVIGRYDALVRHADDLFGELVAQLEESGQLDRSLIVYTADHGEAFGEHGEWSHGRDLHAETVRVPLAMRLPDRVARGTRSDLASLLDLAPTMLAVAGIAPQPTFRGVDLRVDAPREAGASWLVSSELGPSLRAATSSDWKYIVDVRTGEEHLFDRHADPGEQRDVAATEATVVARLRNALAVYLEAGPAALVPVESEIVESEIATELEQQLDALGYVETREPREAVRFR